MLLTGRYVDYVSYKIHMFQNLSQPPSIRRKQTLPLKDDFLESGSFLNLLTIVSYILRQWESTFCFILPTGATNSSSGGYGNRCACGVELGNLLLANILISLTLLSRSWSIHKDFLKKYFYSTMAGKHVLCHISAWVPIQSLLISMGIFSLTWIRRLMTK